MPTGEEEDMNDNFEMQCLLATWGLLAPKHHDALMTELSWGQVLLSPVFPILLWAAVLILLLLKDENSDKAGESEQSGVLRKHESRSRLFCA